MEQSCGFLKDKKDKDQYQGLWEFFCHIQNTMMEELGEKMNIEFDNQKHFFDYIWNGDIEHRNNCIEYLKNSKVKVVLCSDKFFEVANDELEETVGIDEYGSGGEIKNKNTASCEWFVSEFLNLREVSGTKHINICIRGNDIGLIEESQYDGIEPLPPTGDVVIKKNNEIKEDDSVWNDIKSRSLHRRSRVVYGSDGKKRWKN
tara:strand:+ start:546 stop:1154 length:609 start_codon:yes stop_codon:yes gene_type:complete